MKKITVAITALAATGALALAGCSSDEGSKSSSPAATSSSAAPTAGAGFDAGATIGVALPQKTSENWVLAEKLFNDDLTAAGFKPVVQFAAGGVQDQQSQIDSLVQQGAKVIVIGALDGSQLGTQVEAAAAAGVKIIAYDRLIQNTEAVDLYIAYDNYKVGELQGQSLLDGLAARKCDKTKWNIELIAGSNDDANSKPFFEGAMSILQPKIDDGTLTIVSGQNTQAQAATEGWDPKNAQSRMDSIISANYTGGVTLDGVLSPNDTLARAAIESATQAGLDTPVLTGQDSEVESVKSIAEGKQYSTIYKDTRALVAKTIDQIKLAQAGTAFEVNDNESYNNGVKVVPAYLLTPQIVTKDNAEEVWAQDDTLLSTFKSALG